MPRPFSVSVGDHLIISDPVKHCDIGITNTVPPGVVITASLQPANPSIIPGQGATGGTLALHMDVRTAMQLFSQLEQLGLNMGWLQKE